MQWLSMKIKPAPGWLLARSPDALLAEIKNAVYPQQNERKKMAEKTQKCPMCGTKLKMINGRMACKDCGYYLRSQSESIGSANGSQPGSYGSTGSTFPSGSYGSTPQPGPYSSSGSTPQPGPYNSSGNASQPGPYSSSGSASQPGPYRAPSSASQPGSKPSGFKKSVKAVLVSIGSILLIALSSRSVRNGIVDIVQIITTKNNSVADMDYSVSLPSISYPILPSGSTATAAPDTGTPARVVLPDSDFAIGFIETVYGKGYRVITAEEYAAVTALRVNEDDNIVYYQLDHGETQYLYYSDSYHLDVSDLKCFPNLEQLYVEDKMLVPGDLTGFENLYAIHSKNSVKELAKYVPHPENIIDLGTYDWSFSATLDDLSSFPNLLYLTVEADHLKDISALKSFPDLLGLYLDGCKDLTDYSALMSLTQLEELSISSSQLKTIDFIKQMPNLTYLIIEESQVQDINALTSCPMLTNLILNENYKIADHSPIGELNNLAYLTLKFHQNATLPSFRNLTGLTYLSLDNVNDISPLRDAVNITTLVLKHCGSEHLDVLTAMPKLSWLKIDDFWGLTESLAPLTQLPSLEELDISGTDVFGNMEEIFSIPTLKYLYMDDCQVGIDFNAVSPNPNLEVLSMCDVRILRDPSYNNGDKIYLSEHYDFFDNFPNLTELYVSSANLDSIDFVTKLPGLQFLDISNNNVTSLTPLLELKNIYSVWCGKNTILENLPEDSGIRIYTDSRK